MYMYFLKVPETQYLMSTASVHYKKDNFCLLPSYVLVLIQYLIIFLLSKSYKLWKKLIFDSYITQVYMTNDDNPSYKCKKRLPHNLNHVLEYSQNVRYGIHHSLPLCSLCHLKGW